VTFCRNTARSPEHALSLPRARSFFASSALCLRLEHALCFDAPQGGGARFTAVLALMLCSLGHLPL
jgi:hypothetical protein